jgi:hypothetical protein
MFIRTPDLLDEMEKDKRDYNVELLENILFELRLIRQFLTKGE